MTNTSTTHFAVAATIACTHCTLHIHIIVYANVQFVYGFCDQFVLTELRIKLRARACASVCIIAYYMMSALGAIGLCVYTANTHTQYDHRVNAVARFGRGQPHTIELMMSTVTTMLLYDVACCRSYTYTICVCVCVICGWLTFIMHTLRETSHRMRASCAAALLLDNQ